MIYLDFNGTTPIAPEVVDAMLPYLREHFGNPSSGHVFGQRAKAAVVRAREQVAALIGCSPEEVTFTSGGTEANNLAIFGVAEARRARSTIVTSVIEHPATEQPCAWLEKHGRTVERVPVDSSGVVQLERAAQVVSTNVALMSVMHSNNETGVLQPIFELAKLAHAKGALLHTDAAQSLGKVPVHVDSLGVDLLSIAGHKLYAPKGVGALYVRTGLQLEPVLRGAGQERGLRPGTENVASIVGLGVACELAAKNLTASAAQVQTLRDELWHLLASSVQGIELNGHPTLRLPNTLNVRFPKVTGAAVLAAASSVAASTGSACHDGQEHASSVLLAMGLSEAEAVGAVRLTLGRTTTRDEIVAAAKALSEAWYSLI